MRGLGVGESMVGRMGVGDHMGSVFLSRRRSLASSRSLSCKRWLLERFTTRWKGNAWRIKQKVLHVTHSRTGNDVIPVENSFQQ